MPLTSCSLTRYFEALNNASGRVRLAYGATTDQDFFLAAEIIAFSFVMASLRGNASKSVHGTVYAQSLGPLPEEAQIWT